MTERITHIEIIPLAEAGRVNVVVETETLPTAESSQLSLGATEAALAPAPAPATEPAITLEDWLENAT